MAVCLLSLASSADALESHENIKGLFNTTRDVVVKCLECHMDKASEVLQSTHWTWKRPRMINGQQVMYGKKDSLAGFAIDISSNPTRCLKCHISSAPAAGVFEKSAEAEVDCLVCHDTTGRYRRGNGQNPPDQEDFEIIAHNVGKPSPGNCMTCHFADCGLTEPLHPESGTTSRNIFPPADVHITGHAGSYTCQTCHLKDSGHNFSRFMTDTGSQGLNGEGCGSCHTQTPHRLEKLNSHSAAISCTTCHIPEYATQKPAIISWNWFLTGKADPILQSIGGRDSSVLDKNGFTTTRMIRPVYLWDDGGDQVYSRGQRIMPQELTYLQRPSERSAASKIAPFKVAYGTQLYDAKYRYLISPLLSAGDGGVFPDSDWDTIARDGMKAVVLPYSGEYGVAPTASFRRLDHGVTPAKEALDCTDCHGGSSRMDWLSLGYQGDPWSGGQNTQTEISLPGNEDTAGENGKPEPVQEIQILPLPGY